MKFATIYTPSGTCAALVEGEGLREIPGAASLDELLEQGRLADAVTRATGPCHRVESVSFAPVVTRPSKVICVGHNYRAHIEEMGRDIPDHPVLFAKFAHSLLGAGHDIVLPPQSQSVDWECELAVIIGSTVRHATGQQAADAIAGYSLCNDISMRDWQFRTGQWLQGKMWEASTPLGPYLVTADELPASGAIITTAVDGQVKQRGDIHDLVFSPAYLVEYISTIITLNPGDVILTGTPGGVGFARQPQEFLSAGQSVTVALEGLGQLTNRLVAQEEA